MSILNFLLQLTGEETQMMIWMSKTRSPHQMASRCNSNYNYKLYTAAEGKQQQAHRKLSPRDITRLSQ
jgi:hypothetical protein